MKKYSNLEYLRLSGLEKFAYTIATFFFSIPMRLWGLLKAIGRFFKNLGIKIKDVFVNIGRTFIKGGWKTKVSYFIMGFGNLTRGQILRGLLFLTFEIVFILYMVFWGAQWLSQLGTLGTQEPYYVYNEVLDTDVLVKGDNSFKILLYSVLTIFFIIGFVVTWYINIEQNRISEEILATGKPLKSGKDDLRSLVDDQFHKTLLALPLLGILIFTVMPTIFMVLVAFTNYDAVHAGDGYGNLFHWVGLDNFNELLNFSNGKNAYSIAFGEVLSWTLIWAFFATFTNYFLGMFVAIMINKKGIKLKKMWRTILVLTIAIPQFISLLYVSKLFSDGGFILTMLGKYFHVPQTFSFFGPTANPWVSRATVIVINIWIGIPYLMLIATGILMNIPEDLYESAKIDGANVFQQYTKITLPYMIFITGPYLLTSFIGNMNNFNVIYLLTGGLPTNAKVSTAAGSVGYTDLLITWLFKITQGTDSKYYMASVLGILVFVVVAFVSLIVYNVMPSTKNEEDFQ